MELPDDDFDTKPPTKKFKGWFIPANIVRLFEEDRITARELLLLATIDSLVDTELGIPCYASNKWLGEKIHVRDDRTIRGMIGKLKDLGVLAEVEFDGRKRFLETAWSKVPKWKEYPQSEKRRLLKRKTA
jgi:hypothetical protein